MSDKLTEIDDFYNNFNLESIYNYKEKEDNEKDDAYRKCFLDFLKLESYEDDKVHNKICKLYEHTKNIEDLNKQYTDKSQKLMSECAEFGVLVMLSYDELDNYVQTLKLHF
jgi:hypothetical protein